MRQALRDWLLLTGYRVAVPLAGAVPPGLAYPFLDGVADLVRLASPDTRAAVADNLAQVLGGRGRRHAWAVRLVFRHAVRNYYDTFRLPALTDRQVRDFVVVEGLDRLRVALAPGNGAILISAHVSSVAFAAQALALAERGGTVAVEPIEPPKLLDLMLRVRGSHNLTFSPLGPSLFAELSATLRRGEIAFLVVDRDVSGGGVPIPFFGRETPLPIGPALLARRTGAPILPAYVSRRPDGRLQGIIGDPLEIAWTANRRPDLVRITTMVTARLEYHIARYPEQWTVLQRVWK